MTHYEYNRISENELGVGSSIKLDVCDTELNLQTVLCKGKMYNI